MEAEPARIEIKVKRIDLRFLTKQTESSIQEALKIVKRYLKPNLSDTELKAARGVIVTLASAYRTKLNMCGRSFRHLENKYPSWLDTSLRFPAHLIRVKDPSSASQGRPTLPFEDKSIRSQRRQIQEISEGQSDETIPLVKATIRTLKKRGEHELAHAFTEVMKDPDLPLKISRLLVTADPKPFTPTEALKLYQDLGLTNQQYLRLREAVKDKGYKNLFPAYGQIEIGMKQTELGPSTSSATTTTESVEALVTNGTTTPEEQQRVSLTTPEPLQVLPSSPNDTTNVGQGMGSEASFPIHDFNFH